MSQRRDKPYRLMGRNKRAWLRSSNMERRQALLRAREDAMEEDLKYPEQDLREESPDPVRPVRD